MIIFKYVRWKNFLSTGDNFTQILLDKSPTTLIIGENGAGKSTMLDALCFGLFGRPFRSINKPQLINSVNEKNAVVEVCFAIGKKQILVRRGIKPNIFEIEIDGKLLEQNANVRDFQEVLEKQILKLNYKSFTQIVVLGSSSFIPFMQLKSNERKNIIEDLLDITIFSTMNVVLKSYVSENKNDVIKNDNEITLVENKINLKTDFINQLKCKTKKLIDDNQKEIDENKSESIKIKSSIDELNTKINDKLQEIVDLQKVEKDIAKLTQYRQSIQLKCNHEKKSIEFYSKNDDCPTCKQHIESEFKLEEIQKHKQEVEKFEQGLNQIQKENEKLEERFKIIQSIQQDIQNMQSEMQRKYSSLEAVNQYIEKITKNIESLNQSDGDIKKENKELKQLQLDLEGVKEKRKEILDRREVQEVAKKLLQDTGIKTKIIKQYLPIINKLINKYLSELNFFCQFNLDESFNEVIKSRYRDDFSYANFSEGEKQRIDLALLFTWRAIAKLKNSTNTNLLIMDEIFDSSLDTEGIDNLMKILNSFDVNTNVFIISHKGDQLYEKFRSVVKFVKNKNFSEISS